jgi:signal transduction histidine kinase
VWFAVGAHPEVLAALERSLEDQKQLAAEHPDDEARHRRRFEELRTLLQHLRILEHNRDLVARRYEQLLFAAFATVAVLLTGGAWYRQRRQAVRLERLQGALAELADGRTDVRVGERRHDLIGRIAAMVERTSRVMARDRRRLAALQNLSAWQEAARRHAHEMRTPLTGARLELGRLGELLRRESLRRPDDIRQAAESAAQELERLGRFTQEFTTFARLPRPRREPRDLAALIAEFVATFGSAWPNLELELEPPEGEGGATEETRAEVDRDMLRQVLVNLCDNSAHAAGDRPGTVRFRLAGGAEGVTLEVADDGPGIDPAVLPRLFEPYTTTREVGEGMGLGLAISRKILLDHGGDLELVATSPRGTTFRLTFPNADAETRVEPRPPETP